MSVKISNDDHYTTAKEVAISDGFVKNESMNIYQDAGDLKAKFRDSGGVIYNKSLTSSSASTPFYKLYGASDLFSSIIGAQVSKLNDNDLIYLSFSNTGVISFSIEVPTEYAGSEVEISYTMYCPNAIVNHAMNLSSFINRSGVALINSGGIGTAFPNALSANIPSRQSNSIIPAAATVAGDTITVLLERLYVNAENPRLISVSLKFL